MTLDAVQGRILGSLVEKELATPQQYPLTANALLLACNQTSNREPVMLLAEAEVQRALDGLKGERLVRFVFPSHGRSAVRYRHVLDEALGLDERQRALLGVLLLRGPQTVGELRTRTERLARFDRLDDVGAELDALAARSEPLVERLPRRPGQKEERYRQLLAEEAAGGPGSGWDRGAAGSQWPGAAPTTTGAAPVTHPDGHWAGAASAAGGPAGPAVAAPGGGASATATPQAPALTEEAAVLRLDVDQLQRTVADLVDEVQALRDELTALRQNLGG